MVDALAADPVAAFDLDVAWNRARFTGNAAEGDFIPGAPDAVVAAGVSVERYGPWSGALFFRYIGSYPLTEDNKVRSSSQAILDAQIGYEIARNMTLRLDVFNLFNRDVNDITYYYPSRLPDEPPEGVADVISIRAKSAAFGCRLPTVSRFLRVLPK